MGVWAEHYVQDVNAPNFGAPIICFRGSVAELETAYNLKPIVETDGLHVVGVDSDKVTRRFFNFGPTPAELADAIPPAKK